MINLEGELREWRNATVEETMIGELRTHPALQPRDPKATRFRDLAGAERASTQHKERLADLLISSAAQELTALLVARIDGKLYVVDGHHRLAAYRSARRHFVPVRIKEANLKHAALLSKLVNTDGVKLPLTRGQAAECAWQYLISVTDGGRLELTRGASLRVVAARFGVASHVTIANMMKRLDYARELHEKCEFPPQWCDLASGWPKWNDVKRSITGNGWGDAATPEMRELRQAEHFAAALAKLLEKYGPEAYRKACEMLNVEAVAGDEEGEDEAAEVSGTLSPP